MPLRSTLLVGTALCLTATIACTASQNRSQETSAPPFVDPATMAEMTCGGAKAQVTAPGAVQVDFDFAAPFALPDAVVSHFHYPVSTQSQSAQRWFDTGMAHMANFNHDEAIAAFRQAQVADPACAMCYWGEGLAFGSNINAPFDPARGVAGRAATDKAIARLAGTSAREVALIQALDTRYTMTEGAGASENAADYADAVDAVAHRYSGDKVILALAAEANMDTQPWDYWQAGARVPKGRTARTLELIEDALKIDPEFAPAIHLYIHTTEGSVDPFRAESYADSLLAQSLGVGHLIHMPSHTYLRLGRWQKAISANIQAIEVDERYIAGSTNAVSYAQVYYPHNVHFVVASAQLAGDAKTATAMTEKLKKVVVIDPAAPAPLVEHLAAAEIFTALQFGTDADVLAIPEPSTAHLYLSLAWHYARGVTFTRLGDMEGAKTHLANLEAMFEAPDLTLYNAYGVPLVGIFDTARLTLEGRIQAAKGDLTAAIDRFDAASDAQEALPYFEPAWWHTPTRQTLGALLLEDGQYDRAVREFYRSLIKAPNNAYALHGLAEAYKAKGDKHSEDYARHLFEEAWMGADGQRPDLSDL